MAFFKYEGEREDIIQVVVDNSDLITKAHKRFKTFTKNDELIELYEARQKYQMDRDTAIGYAEIKGIEQGKQETAIKLKKLGVTIDVIIEATGLSKSEIENLK